LEAETLHHLLLAGQATWKDLHRMMGLLWGPPEPAVASDLTQGTYLLGFLGAAAVQENGTLMAPAQLVALIARLKYAARSFCMVEATLEVEKPPVDPRVSATICPHHFTLLFLSFFFNMVMT
jgi:hypothetical protein